MPAAHGQGDSNGSWRAGLEGYYQVRYSLGEWVLGGWVQATLRAASSEPSSK